MKSLKKYLAAALILLLSVCALQLPALAAGSNVTYSGNAGKFIFAPGSEYSLTDLFQNFKDVMPGDMLTQTIAVNNDANNKVKVRIYMRSLGATDESYVDFLNQLRLTVRKTEDTPMFDAAADQTDGLTEWTYIGTLYSGGKTELNVTLDVPTSMDNRFQDRYGEIEWQFMVEELPVSPDDPKPPKTGDDARPWLWIILIAVSTTVIVITGKSRKSEKRAER